MECQQVGVYSDAVMAGLALERTYRFNPVPCAGIDACVRRLVVTRDVNALLVPYVDVLSVPCHKQNAQKHTI